MSNLTDRDLSRLLTLQYVHDGEMRHLAHVVSQLFEALEKAKFVRTELEKPGEAWSDEIETRITTTDKGRRVAEAGMTAMRIALGHILIGCTNAKNPPR